MPAIKREQFFSPAPKPSGVKKNVYLQFNQPVTVNPNISLNFYIIFPIIINRGYIALDTIGKVLPRKLSIAFLG